MGGFSWWGCRWLGLLFCCLSSQLQHLSSALRFSSLGLISQISSPETKTLLSRATNMPLALAAAGLGFALSAIVHELCDIREEKSLQPTNYHPQPVSSRTKFQPPASQTNTGTASGRLQTRKHRGFAVSPTDPTLTLVKTFPSFDVCLSSFTVLYLS
jgi:hypothetical protein